MSVSFSFVSWNKQKKGYDLVLALFLALALGSFIATSLFFHPQITLETLLLRASSTTALLLLHVILAIGPLARLNSVFLPLLYNRRHLGVTFFFLALFHAIVAIIQFHTGGDTNPLLSVVASYAEDYRGALQCLGHLGFFPFEIFGLAALVVFMLMALTSHDFWLKHLGPSAWKRLHQGVYLAYGLILTHVVLGGLQSERSPLFLVFLVIGATTLVTLHLWAFFKERSIDRQKTLVQKEGFIPIPHLKASQLIPDQGQVVVMHGERIALYLHNNRIYALSNACRHQGGPLGEGRIVYDCITCPWHGYQYRPQDGCSPPPFAEIVPTYGVRVVDDQIYLSEQPLPLQTRSQGAPLSLQTRSAQESAPFYIGWQERMNGLLAQKLTRFFIALGIVGVGSMAILAYCQNRIDPGGFEFGSMKEFRGVVYADPIALLHVVPIKASEVNGEGQNFCLVGEGKFRPPEAFMKKAAGHLVTFRASPFYWHNMVMLEINQPEKLQLLDQPESMQPSLKWTTPMEKVSVSGELVDTKCFFGVMRPATGKVHRACAARCLSGGVPPGLLVHDERQNRDIVLLLAGAPGQPLKLDPEWAARAVTATGTLEIYKDLYVLRTTKLELK